ncbi:MAG: N-acetylmuramoyl-L-alanine amidase [Elusimicrobia bacterium]|nr:N-acetylmuramoyl-L-alanine amidase [Elusimicrobiota bacterium]
MTAFLAFVLCVQVSAQVISTDVISGMPPTPADAPAAPAVDAPAAEAPAPKSAKKNRRRREKRAKETVVEPAPALAVVEPPPPPAPIVPVLEVMIPKEREFYPYLARSFTFGRTNPGAALTINGQSVQVLPSGAFFAMVPFSSGTFNLDFEAKFSGISISTRRVVQVASPTGPEPAPGEVLALEPSEDVEALPGELLVVRCKGAAGGEASFTVGKLARDVPMAPNAFAAGLYEGHVYLPRADKHEPVEVQCRVKGKGGGKAVGPGKVTVLDPLQTRTALTSGRVTALKAGETGFNLFLPAGVRLEATGRRGGMARVRLSETEEGWVDQKSLIYLAAGTPPPRAVIGRSITTKASDRAVRVMVSASERVAYEVRQTEEPLGFEVRFFNARQRFDRARFDSEDGLVRDIRGRQDSADVVRLSVDTKVAWGWGYAAGYDASGTFYLEIRRPPDLTRGANVLAGRRVVLDPGHGPEPSVVGPLGNAERELNLAIAGALEGLLLGQGAEVYMTRRSSDGPPLGERPWLAYEAKGDVFISIHNNGLPVTADPADAPRGFMHFYYHPQSRRLAEAVMAAYRERHPELPDEGLHWGDLAVCRGTYMPAILTESAYVILPEQEERLRRPDYQKRLAGTILAGLESYLKDYQRLQRRFRAERVAARVKPPKQ